MVINIISDFRLVQCGTDRPFIQIKRAALLVDRDGVVVGFLQDSSWETSQMNVFESVSDFRKVCPCHNERLADNNTMCGLPDFDPDELG